jgi:hypothetical protein
MRAMPLPRSLTCSSCQHTYPDGWRRCPYCGFDPEKQKRDRQIERALARKFPSYAAVVNTGGEQKPRQQSRRDRNSPSAKPEALRGQPQADVRDGGRKRSRRRRGRRRQGGTAEPGTQSAAPDARPPQSPRERTRGPEARPRNEQPAGTPAQPRPERPAGDQDNQPGRNRRRRPRRRRKPTGGGPIGASPGGEKGSDG